MTCCAALLTVFISATNVAAVAAVTDVRDPSGWCTARGVFPSVGQLVVADGFFFDDSFSADWLIGNTVLPIVGELSLGAGFFHPEFATMLVEHSSGLSLTLDNRSHAGLLRIPWDGIPDPPLSINRPGYADCEFRLTGIVAQRIPGDANLDGRFDSEDLVSLFIGFEYEDAFENNSTWSEGDFNADADFDSEDLVVAFLGGHYENVPVASAHVPEPTALRWLFAAVVWAACRRRR